MATLEEIRREGLNALRERLGQAGMIRFLAQFENGAGLFSRGDVGTVVLVHDGRGYEVEFITLEGETLAVVSLAKNEVRPIAAREIAHARVVAN